MRKVDVVNSPEFIEAVDHCVSKSIEACESCGASYSEAYLKSKWENRLIDTYETGNTAQQLIDYAESEFVF